MAVSEKLFDTIGDYMARAQLRQPAESRRELVWRPDRQEYRVWRTTWAGDQFEVLSDQEFAALQRICQRFNIPLTEADDED